MMPKNRDEAIALLKGTRRRIEHWNDFWAALSEGGPEARAAVLGSRGLRGINLEHANLIDVDLSHAWMPESDLGMTQLRRAKLARACLFGSSLNRTNLTDADLRGADLSHVRTYGEGTCGAHLGGADLTGATLTSAQLPSAGMARCVLVNADLQGATLTRANLEGADLRGANLSDADLSNATVSGASFHGAHLSGTTLHCDLTDARGLDQAAQGPTPSRIGWKQLLALPAPFPQTFLRGCGVPDDLIDFCRSHQGAILFYDTFLSYSHADVLFTTRLHDAMQGQGVRCWRDEKNMDIGNPIRATVNEAIRLRDRIVLVCSQASLTSRWVTNELRIAFDEEERRQEAVILPVLLDHYLINDFAGEFAAELRDRLAADFIGWDKDAAIFESQVNRVVAALRSRAPKAGGRSN